MSPIAVCCLIGLINSPGLCCRLSARLHRQRREREAVPVLERFALSQNPLQVAHILVAWHDILNQAPQASEWLRFGLARQEPKAFDKSAVYVASAFIASTFALTLSQLEVAQPRTQRSSVGRQASSSSLSSASRARFSWLDIDDGGVRKIYD